MNEMPAGWNGRNALAHRMDSQRRRILVIDDRFDTVAAMRSVLELSGHDVEVAYDGEGGIDKALQTGPDVILCDIELPGPIDGYGVAERLRASNGFHSTYMVAITGCTDADDVRRAVAAGFDLHVAKPADMHVLERLMSEWFEDGDGPEASATPLSSAGD
jgi:CheY-like chemotaxis protein